MQLQAWQRPPQGPQPAGGPVCTPYSISPKFLDSRGCPWGSRNPSLSLNALLLPGMTQTQGSRTFVSQRPMGQPLPPWPPTRLKSAEMPTRNV